VTGAQDLDVLDPATPEYLQKVEDGHVRIDTAYQIQIITEPS